jgi:hypothetical protein
VLAILEGIAKLDSKAQQRLLPKIRYPLIYYDLVERLEERDPNRENDDAASDYLRIANRRHDSDSIKEIFYHAFIRPSENALEDVILEPGIPTLESTIRVLKAALNQGLIEDSDFLDTPNTHVRYYKYIFGVGFDVAASRDLLSILESAGTVKGFHNTDVPVKELFQISEIPQGSYVTMMFDRNGSGVHVDVNSRSSTGFGRPRLGQNIEFYWYCFE